ncbi:hypothetical protein XENTR_v10018862 [Xenopus tropicalis]|nr:hypothetical protein XENTR_v10018862 [Xenopus tropicalis]
MSPSKALVPAQQQAFYPCNTVGRPTHHEDKDALASIQSIQQTPVTPSFLILFSQPQVHTTMTSTVSLFTTHRQ